MGVFAPSGTGKTTLLSDVIPCLIEHELRVGCVKHTHHRFEIDQSGKDSYRMQQAGANQMLLGAADRWALMVRHNEAGDDSLLKFIERLELTSLDIILVEGFSIESIPKIALHRQEIADAPSCEALAAKNGVVAVASNLATPPQLGVTVLDLNNIRQIADFIINYTNTSREMA